MDGTLSILYHPVPEGWVGFAIEDNGTITMKRLPRFREDALAAVGVGGKELSAALLVPFAEPITRAQRLRFSGPAKLMRLPFEALPWKDGLLTDVASVRYGFDAPIATNDHVCQGAPRALVVTNPLGDLAGAESSGAGTRKTLVALGWVVEWLEGAAAKREAIMAALQDPCTKLFHYDGHARFEGRDGLRAALMLRDDALTVSDLLSLPRVPQAIVLLGCATAKDEGLGLAQGFLQRGSREVLATTEDVDDTLSQRIAERLYDGAPAASAGPPELAMALRAAVKSARGGAGGADDPSRFRVLTR
jgi:CHAT domain-containing protein